MPVTSTGSDKIMADLMKIAQALSPGSIEGIMKDAGNQGVTEAKARARVKTGRMRDSVKWTQQGAYQGTLGSDVDYAIYNELGTFRRSAQPFITPGAQVTLQAIGKALTALLKT